MNQYVELARSAIENYLTLKKIIQPPKDLPQNMLKNQAGVFVTLHRKHGLTRNEESQTDAEGELRGCIGTFLPTKENIACEIIDNAIAAATQDYRFNPVKLDELKDLDISVDILSEPEPVQGLSSLDPKKYGVIVKSEDGRSGLLLPDIEGVDSPEYQIAICREKAGIGSTEPVYLYRFEVIRYKE